MINRTKGTVKFPVLADVSASWAPGREIVSGSDQYGVEFTYRDSRPFEIEMLISGTNNRWLFERDIVFDGLEPGGRGGIGDVQVYNDGDEFCYMRLDSLEGWCVLRFRMAQMRGFAREMKNLIPRGREHVSMDLVIAQIIAQGM